MKATLAAALVAAIMSVAAAGACAASWSGDAAADPAVVTSGVHGGLDYVIYDDGSMVLGSLTGYSLYADPTPPGSPWEAYASFVTSVTFGPYMDTVPGGVLVGMYAVEDVFFLCDVVYSIGACAFSQCSSLGPEVHLPMGVMVIFDYAFNGCTSLELIGIPLTLQVLAGVEIFTGCTSLTHLVASHDISHGMPYRAVLDCFEPGMAWLLNATTNGYIDVLTLDIDSTYYLDGIDILPGKTLIITKQFTDARAVAGGLFWSSDGVELSDPADRAGRTYHSELVESVMVWVSEEPGPVSPPGTGPAAEDPWYRETVAIAGQDVPLWALILTVVAAGAVIGAAIVVIRR